MKIRPFLLERYFAKHEFSVPYLLSSSDCEAMALKELLGFEPESTEQLQNLWLGYTDSLGHPDLRKEISQIYSTIKPHEVLVHTGAEEVIFNFMHSHLEPGDHVIVQFPAYQSLYDVANSIGCEVTLWPGNQKNGWELDLNFLNDHIRAKTKLIVVNSPHNPTGYLMSHEKQKDLVAILKKHGIALLFDEVYRELEYSTQDRLPAACDLYERAVSIGVLSKTYGLPGLRIGWLATHDREIFEKMAVMKDFTTICNSVPSEFLATLALRHREKIADRNRKLVQRNLEIFKRFLSRHEATLGCILPRAGALAFPFFKNGENSEEISETLIREQGLMLLPGKCFDYDDAYFRIGLGRKNFPEVLQKFDDWLLTKKL